jgi:very-short-patch-repair endonuclease/predicted transcriptional regulator of viral defense system
MSAPRGAIWFMNAHERIARLFASQHGVVTRHQALAGGLPAHRIDYLLKVGRWEPVHVGVYRLLESPATWHQRLLGACLAAGRGAVASHRSAARVWDLAVSSERIELTIPNSRCLSIPGATVHRTICFDGCDRRVVKGIPVTTVARTLIDVASVISADDLEATLDDALSRRLVDARYLARRVGAIGTRGRKGAGMLAHLLVARLGGRGSPESPFETRLAQALRRRAVRPPVPQFRVRLPSGRVARLDFAYPDARLAIEADSYRYHSSLSDWSRDRLRHNELVALGWRVLPLTFAELQTDPIAVADQVARCLRSAHV